MRFRRKLIADSASLKCFPLTMRPSSLGTARQPSSCQLELLLCGFYRFVRDGTSIVRSDSGSLDLRHTTHDLQQMKSVDRRQASHFSRAPIDHFVAAVWAP